MQGNPETNNKVWVALVGTQAAATVTGTGQDVSGFEDLLVIVNANTFVGAASVVVTIEESTAVGGTYAAVLTFPAITTANDAGTKTLGRIRLPSRHKFMRAVATYTGNGTTEVAPVDVYFVGCGPHESSRCNDTYAVTSVT
jgi:hypothetical protein